MRAWGVYAQSRNLEWMLELLPCTHTAARHSAPHGCQQAGELIAATQATQRLTATQEENIGASAHVSAGTSRGPEHGDGSRTCCSRPRAGDPRAGGACTDGAAAAGAAPGCVWNCSGHREPPLPDPPRAQQQFHAEVTSQHQSKAIYNRPLLWP